MLKRIITTFLDSKDSRTRRSLRPTVENRTVRPILISLCLAIFLSAGCSSKRSELTGPVKHYTLTGQILSLDPKAQTANINAAAIPNYMDAMAMDFPIPSKADFNTLHVGDKIKATLNVSASGDDYNLSNIQKQTSGSK